MKPRLVNREGAYDVYARFDATWGGWKFVLVRDGAQLDGEYLSEGGALRAAKARPGVFSETTDKPLPEPKGEGS